VTVRRATAEDLDRYLPLAAAFHNASPVHSALPFDYEGFTNFYLSGIDNPNMGIWVAEEDGRVMGITGACCYPMYFSPTNRVVQELWWYLKPEARGNGVGKQMYDAIELWTKEQGATALFMIALEDERSPKMLSLYLRQGFKPMERTFFKEVA
jgi:GNAT superfamily N-acetyltransferase